MEIAKIIVNATTGRCLLLKRIPAGIVGATVTVEFCDPIWDRLTKTVVFRGSEAKVAEFDGNTAVIPWEVLQEPGQMVFFGIWGSDPESDLQLPLIEVMIGAVETATDPSTDPATDPTLPVWAQLQQDVEELKRNSPGGPEAPGKDGEDGATFTPSLAADGTLSWTNDKNLPNPDPVNIQGPTGPRGPQGPAGESIMGPVGPMGPRGLDGDDGGHYVPAVTQPDDNTLEFSFTPSKADMPAVEPVQVELPAGQGNGGNANQGAGLTATEKNLMLTLFKAVPYQSDVSATMKSLEAIWSGGSSGGENPDIPDVTNYTVTYNLTSVTADSTPASVVEGGSLTVNLIPGTNAVLGEVVVTMGGVDVTATAYSNGQISISSVTGNVVITATADVAKYTQVEYIESIGTGSGCAGHINTGYVPAATDVVEVDFASTKTSWDYIFSCYGGGYYGIRNRLNGAYTTFTRGTGNNITFADPDPNFIPVSGVMYSLVETEPGVATIADPDGNVVANLRDANAVNITAFSNPIFLFCNSSGSSPYGMTSEPGVRIGKFRVKDVYGAVKLDLISVLDENNVACMYDKVSGEYLYNANTVEGSAFIAGGAV